MEHYVIPKYNITFMEDYLINRYLLKVENHQTGFEMVREISPYEMMNHGWWFHDVFKREVIEFMIAYAEFWEENRNDS